VTPSRYRHYRRALGLTFALEAHLGMKDSDLLRELAQDLLLTRGNDPQDAEPLLDHLARALTRLIEEGSLSRGVSTELWREIRHCGPGLERPALDENQAAERPQEVAR
jgi:hypothetical protein